MGFPFPLLKNVKPLGVKRVSIVVLAAAAGLGGQAPANKSLLENKGKPIQVQYQCSLDDMHSAGLDCTEEEPCPVYLELSAVESVGNRIFAAGNIHSSSNTLYSILLASDDAGKTWREPFERLRSAGFDHIQFVDFENGWVSGALWQPLGRDPFLLITADGGQTWRRRPLFEENRAGSILQFWFSSRNNGSLVLENGESGRYELYESPNGGDTWMLRETNEKPIRLRRATGGNTDWRIRADSGTRAFMVERRQGERWVVLSAFLVALKPCSPPAVPPLPAAAPPAF